MSPVSNGMSIALDALKDQISQATERLKRIPGGEGAELLFNEDPQEGVSDCMCFEGGEIRVYKYNQHNDESYDHSPIMELPFAIRVEAASRIPELIDNAFAREDEVLGYVEEVTLKIKDHLNSV